MLASFSLQLLQIWLVPLEPGDSCSVATLATIGCDIPPFTRAATSVCHCSCASCAQPLPVDFRSCVLFKFMLCNALQPPVLPIMVRASSQWVLVVGPTACGAEACDARCTLCTRLARARVTVAMLYISTSAGTASHCAVTQPTSPMSSSAEVTDAAQA